MPLVSRRVASARGRATVTARASSLVASVRPQLPSAMLSNGFTARSWRAARSLPLAPLADRSGLRRGSPSQPAARRRRSLSRYAGFVFGVIRTRGTTKRSAPGLEGNWHSRRRLGGAGRFGRHRLFGHRNPQLPAGGDRGGDPVVHDARRIGERLGPAARDLGDSERRPHLSRRAVSRLAAPARSTWSMVWSPISSPAATSAWR